MCGTYSYSDRNNHPKIRPRVAVRQEKCRSCGVSFSKEADSLDTVTGARLEGKEFGDKYVLLVL